MVVAASESVTPSTTIFTVLPALIASRPLILFSRSPPRAAKIDTPDRLLMFFSSDDHRARHGPRQSDRQCWRREEIVWLQQTIALSRRAFRRAFSRHFGPGPRM